MTRNHLLPGGFLFATLLVAFLSIVLSPTVTAAAPLLEPQLTTWSPPAPTMLMPAVQSDQSPCVSAALESSGTTGLQLVGMIIVVPDSPFNIDEGLTETTAALGLMPADNPESSTTMGSDDEALRDTEDNATVFLIAFINDQAMANNDCGDIDGMKDGASITTTNATQVRATINQSAVNTKSGTDSAASLGEFAYANLAFGQVGSTGLRYNTDTAWTLKPARTVLVIRSA